MNLMRLYRVITFFQLVHRSLGTIGRYIGKSIIESTICDDHFKLTLIVRDTEYYGHDVDTFNINRWLTDDLKDFNTKMKYFQ